MKAPCLAVLVAGLLLLLPPTDSDAQILLWDPSSARGVQGGTGDWLGANNWQTVLLENNVAWIEGADAVFGETPGTVFINGGGVTANQLIFNVNGYIIDDGFGVISLGGAAPRIDVGAGHTATIRAPIFGTGITKTGAGTLLLSGPRDNSMSLTVADGTLHLDKRGGETNIAVRDLVIGDGIGSQNSARVFQFVDNQIAFTSRVTIATDGLWEIGLHAVTIAGLTMTGGTMPGPLGEVTLFGGNVTATSSSSAAAFIGVAELNLAGATRVFDVALGPNNAADLQVSARITNGGVTKVGSGRLILSENNTFAGPIAINGGIVLVPSVSDSSVNGSLGAGSSISFDGGTLTFTGATDSTNRAVTLNAGGGTVNLTTATTTLTMTGALSGAGGLTKAGAGMLTLSGTPTYAGNTLITAGTLTLNGGIASAVGNLTVNAPGTLQARTIVNRAVAGDGTITATGTLTIGDPNSAAGFSFDGTLAVGANFVALSDADVAQLGAATTLGAGAWLDSLNGSILGSGRSVTVAAGVSASISGDFTNNGTVNGPTMSSQLLTFLGDVTGVGDYAGNVRFLGQLSPGLSAAAVSLENFELDSRTTLSIELGGINAGAQFDQLDFTGTGLLDGTLSVSLINGFNPQPGSAFAFIQGGALSGAFDTMNLPSLDPGFSWSYSQTANAATLAVVPEPAVSGLLAAGAFAMALARRRETIL